ncbi:hypothetical protein PanWU01x14_046290 [Parasponia andersonii]|uniref:Uncharacterized protein n=1 Tax=Parasponia andersonii TaxID=3476 RepID=A0A2P5DNP6_PARAD|nr:hypothetical protein PanWU01x14_046290 [Parasponia andersonii]
MQRHSLILSNRFLYSLLRRPNSSIDDDRFRSHSQVSHALSKNDIALGHSQKVTSLVTSNSLVESRGVSQPDIFAGEPYQSTSNVERLLPSFQHSGQPIHSRVGVVSPHGLVQRAYQIVVLFSGLVVRQVLTLQGLSGILQTQSDDRSSSSSSGIVPCGCSGGRGCRDFQGVKRHPSIAVAICRNEAEDIVLDVDRPHPNAGSEPNPGIVGGPPEESGQMLGLQWVEDEDSAAREKRRDEMERRVLRSGPDEDDAPVLDNGEERVLLGLVEPVNLVDEQHRSPPILVLGSPGFVDGVSDVLDAASDGREGDESVGVGVGAGKGVENGSGDGGLAGPRWAPEEEGGETVADDG